MITLRFRLSAGDWFHSRKLTPVRMCRGLRVKGSRPLADLTDSVAALGRGNTIFLKASNAANGTFIMLPLRAVLSRGDGFETTFSSNNASPSAGNGTFLNNSATIRGAVGGKTAFYESSTADSATLIANGGIGRGVWIPSFSTALCQRLIIRFLFECRSREWYTVYFQPEHRQ